MWVAAPATAEAQFWRGRHQPLPADTQAVIDTLPNGLTYYVRANREPRNRAELRLVVDAGSVLEDADQRGAAHFVEHMAFNGTQRFPKHALVDYLESVGMQFGADLNAYTGFDETVYMLTVPTDTPGVLTTGLEILRDWADGITFDSAEVRKERGVVIEEWRLQQGLGTRARDKQLPVLLERSRYPNRLPIGDLATLETVEPEVLQRFYEDWYRPNLMAVIAVGDFDAAQVEQWIRTHFADLSWTFPQRPRQRFSVPVGREMRIQVLSDPEATHSTLGLYQKRDIAPGGTLRSFRVALVRQLFGSMLYDRLFDITEQPDAPVLSVSTYQGPLVRSKAVDVLNATIRNNRVEEGLTALLAEVRRIARFGFTPTELERAKRELLRQRERWHAEQTNTPSAQFAGDYVGHFLFGDALLDAEAEYALFRETIAAIRLGEVNARAADWNRDRDRTLLVTVPEKPDTRVPDPNALRAAVQTARRQRVTPYVDSVPRHALLPVLPKPGRIVAERELPRIGATEWTLSNGARVILKPTDFKQDEVLFAAQSPGGTSLAPDSLFVPALTAAGVAQIGGLGDFSLSDLVKKLSGKVAGVGASIDPFYERLHGVASPRDLETLFQLAYLQFQEPRVDSAAFLVYQSRALANLENRAADPQTLLRDTLRLTLASYHPRAYPLSTTMLAQLDMERSLEFYRDRFRDAGDFTFFLVGNLTPDSLRAPVQRYLASLPSTGRREQGRDPGIRPPTGVVRKTVWAGIEPKAQTQIVFSGRLVWDREQLYLLKAVADVLELRLRETLREDLGGTYGVSVSASASAEPYARFHLVIGFGTAPERLEELTRATFHTIQALQAQGPTPQEVHKVREAHSRARETDLRDNNFWLMQLTSYARSGWELESIATADERIRALAPEPIRQAARAYLDAANYVQVSLLPRDLQPAAPPVPARP